MSVMKPGSPVIGKGSVGSLRGILRKEGNQGGTAKVFSSLRSYDLGDFFIIVSKENGL